MIVDRMTEADRERWAELWEQYLEFYATVLPPAQYDHTWARLRGRLDDGGRMGGFAARDAEAGMVGLTHYLFHAHGWSMAPSCYLQDLFVDPAYRGGGAGAALIDAVAEAARDAGADRLYWLTHEDNAVARGLYDKVASYSGFVVYRRPLA